MSLLLRIAATAMALLHCEDALKIEKAFDHCVHDLKEKQTESADVFVNWEWIYDITDVSRGYSYRFGRREDTPSFAERATCKQETEYFEHILGRCMEQTDIVYAQVESFIR